MIFFPRNPSLVPIPTLHTNAYGTTLDVCTTQAVSCDHQNGSTVSFVLLYMFNNFLSKLVNFIVAQMDKVFLTILN